MKSLIIILFSITHIIMYGQSSCKYENYFIIVGEASYDAYLKYFEPAQSKYKKAFSEIHFPLGQDLRKALKVAKKVKDTAWTQALSITLAKGGIPLSYFNDLKDYSWYNKFQLEFVNYQTFYKSTFDLGLRQQLLDLRTQDSIFNENYHNWRQGQKQMTLDELIFGAKEIYNAFKYIYDKHGFPCEQKMGYYFKNGEIENYPMSVLMIHIYQRGIIFIEDRLAEVVCEGKWRPEELSSLQGFKGFGEKNIGIEQEMRIRYEMVKSTEKKD